MAAQELVYTSLYADADLLAYYRMESGALTTDSKGNYTLTNVGTVEESASGKFGYCANVGTTRNKYFTQPNISLNTSANFAVSFWVKLPSEITDTLDIFFNLSDTTHFKQIQCDYLYNEGTPQLRIYVDTIGTGGTGTTYTVSLGNTWHHIVINSVNYGQTVTCYLDGNTTPVITGGKTGNGNTGGLNRLGIGVDTGNAGMRGLVDDFSFFTRTLTTDEISGIYNGTLGSTSPSSSISTSPSISSSVSSSVSSSPSISTSVSSSPSTSTSSSISTSPSPSVGDLLSNLRAYWKLNESAWNGVANEIIDYSGNGLHGYATGDTVSTTVADAKFGRCARFLGEYCLGGGSPSSPAVPSNHTGATFPNIPGLVGTHNISMQMWVKEISANDWVRLEGSGQYVKNAAFFYQDEIMQIEICLQRHPTIIFWIRTTDSSDCNAPAYDWWGQEFVAATDISGGSWHHVVCTYDGSYLRTYIDGVKQTDKTATGNLKGGSSGFYLGNVQTNTWNIRSDMARFAVWNRTLSQSEVDVLYNDGDGYDFVSTSISSSPSTSVSSSISSSPSTSISTSISSSLSTSISSSISTSISSSISSSLSASPSEGSTTYSKGDYVSLPTNDSDLNNSYSVEEVINVSTKNDVRVSQNGTGYVIHQYKDFIGDAAIANIEWEGQSNESPLLSKVYLQIYNRVTEMWDIIDSDEISAGDTDFSLSGDVNVTNYKTTDKMISCRVYQQFIS